MIDTETIMNILTSAAWIVPVITGIIQVIRAAMSNAINERYLPLISLFLGVIIVGFVLGWTTLGILVGLIFGLAASGFYDLGKKTVAGK